MYYRIFSLSVLVFFLSACGKGVEEVIQATNSVPEALDVRIVLPEKGVATLGDTISGSYQFFDKEGDAEAISRYQWFRDGEIIQDANNQNYIVTEEDKDRTLIFQVIPIASTGDTVGNAAKSPELVVGNEAPKAHSIQILMSDTPANKAGVGQTLSLSYVYTDLEGDSEDKNNQRFQWYRDGSLIPNATNDTYTVNILDLNKAITVSIRPAAKTGSQQGAEFFSDEAVSIVNSSPVATNLMIASNSGNLGSVVVGTQLSASYQYYDADENTESGTIIQWYRGDTPIMDNANSNTYKIVSADSGNQISFSVTPGASAGVQKGSEVFSVGVLVQNSAPAIKSDSVSLASTGASLDKLHVGETLSASFVYSDPDNDPPSDIHQYQWYRGTAPIVNAQSKSYTVTTVDNTQMISVKVWPKQFDGVTGDSLNSAPVLVVNRPPQLIGIPTINNTTSSNINETYVGHQLSASYVFSDPDGDAEGASEKAWVSGGAIIVGSNSNSYKVDTLDSGQGIKFLVSKLKDIHGLEVLNTSASEVVTVKNSPPSVESITILGTNTIGNALTASVKISDLDGDIAGSHRYQWKRDGVNIGGETESNQYNLGLGDAGREISVEVRPQDVKGKFGVSKLSSAKTIAAPDLNFSASAETKRLKFSWNSIPQASFYKLLYNPDGVSGYSPLDSNLIATSFDMDISVHRFNWVNASLVLEACNTNTCYSTPPKGVANLMLNSIGYLKASNSGYDDRFGHTLTISSDGNTLAVGAYNEGNSFRGVLNSADTEPDDNTMVGAGAVYVFVRELNVWTQQAYIKASNTRGDDYFGSAIALSADGNTLAVGASREASANKGVINSATADPGDNDAIDSGAVYVFTRDNGAWNQQAYIKASNTATYALFGISVALSADGNTLAVGSQYEKSSANSIIHSATADPDVGLAYLSGAVYTFVRNSSQWNQQAYIKASNSGPSDQFGSSVALSSDGNTLAVGAIGEDSATKQIINSGNYPTDSLASHAGAVYVYNRVEGLWSKRAYIKASNAEKSDVFGFSVSLSGDGKILAVGAPGEGSLLSTDTENNDSSNVGAAYIYRLGASGWGQETYLKASNPNTLFGFGLPLQLSRNGNALLVGSWREASRTKGVNLGEEFEPGNYVSGSVGAGYLFKSTLNTWKQQAYIKASNSEEGDYFSVALSINSDATIIVMGASGEDSASKSTDTALDQSDNSLDASGAVYLY